MKTPYDMKRSELVKLGWRFVLNKRARQLKRRYENVRAHHEGGYIWMPRAR